MFLKPDRGWSNAANDRGKRMARNETNRAIVSAMAASPSERWRRLPGTATRRKGRGVRRRRGGPWSAATPSLAQLARPTAEQMSYIRHLQETLLLYRGPTAASRAQHRIGPSSVSRPFPNRSLSVSRPFLIPLVRIAVSRPYERLAYAFQTRLTASVTPTSLVSNSYRPTPTVTVAALSSHQKALRRPGYFFLGM